MMRQAALSVRALTALESRLWAADCITRLSSPAHADAATPSHDGMHARCFSTPAAFRARVCDTKPQTLQHDRYTGEVEPGSDEGPLKRFLLKLGGYYSRESKLMRGSKGLYQSIVETSEDPKLREALALPPTFAATYSLLCLHVFMLLVRLRAEGNDGADLAQILYEGFQDDVELRVHAEGVKVRVSKWLKELEKMFYGACEAYEKALKGEADMTDALLRNVYGDEPAMRSHADTLARYVKREIACLKLTPTEAVMKGHIQFSRDVL